VKPTTSASSTSTIKFTSTTISTSTKATTTSATSTKTSSTSSAPASTATGTVAKYGQCGGASYVSVCSLAMHKVYAETLHPVVPRRVLRAVHVS
jgi:hypothetical protein